MKKQKRNKAYIPYLVLVIAVVLIYIVFTFFRYDTKKMNYAELLNHINKNEVKEITITPQQRGGVYRIVGSLKEYKEDEKFILKAPLSDETISQLFRKEIVNKEDGSFQKINADYEIVVKSDPDSSSVLTLLVNIAPFLIFGLFIFWFLSNQIQSSGRSLDFAKSTAKRSTNPKLTFKDVAGLKEEKEELKEMIDFLKAPKKFMEMGARIPKGLLLVGPPGTGKTMLAKAVAGEAKVPFFYMSGSDFLELFVGVGASRVRDLFKEAKKNAPCLIFIDEIDTIGRRRGSGNGGGHDEREQTLNQLLSEMDGFEENEGVIVMAATNRPDVLDPALLRPGRFDRQVTVDLPDKKERLEILKVHAKNKTFGADVVLKNIANRTPGFSGADLENVLNEAALLTVRRNKKFITMEEIDEGTDRVIGGPAKHSKKYTDHEKRVVAFHEAGHAVVGIKLKHAEEVHKITIIPRGDAGGYTLMLPKEERYLSTKNELLERISGLFGGRVAEEVFFDDITTGAHNDFEKATKIARSMVTEYGMSKLGPVQLETRDKGYYLGEYNRLKNYSDEVAHDIDMEVSKILDKAYQKTKKIIEDNKDLVTLIAETLLEKETLNKEEIDALVETGKLPVEESYEDMTLEELKGIAKDKGFKEISKLNKEEIINLLENKESNEEEEEV